jgi:hypothetical protein
VAKVWAEGSPARAHGGDWRWRPRRLGVTVRRAHGWAMRDPGRCYGSLGGAHARGGQEGEQGGGHGGRGGAAVWAQGEKRAP